MGAVPRPFYIGLNMSGTVSAGAYTAGVIDFLVEAMDAWYAERDRQTQQFGADYTRWSIPGHEAQLAVMAGASGGGITAALAAAALAQNFAHVRDQSPRVGAPANTLFQSWVRDIDLSTLLGHADLDKNGGKLVSLLDSTPIRAIASHALRMTDPLSARRAWVRDGLKVILTLTNVAGVPYAIEPQTDADSARALYHADRRQFEVLWNAAPSGGETVALAASGGAAWEGLAEAAIATSAFPVVLAPQVLNRTAGEYNRRRWRIPVANPKCGPNGTCECETSDLMPPTWKLQDGAGIATLNVDGGATNNSPFDCARLELAGLPPAVPGGHNARDPKQADRAVISIAPLYTDVSPDPPRLPDLDLASFLFGFVNAVVSQSRLQGENLRLSADPDVASRWVIAPTPEISGVEPLAGSLLSAFGAFVSQRFREHDYQLGRRNCQRFLTTYFALPADNVLLSEYGAASGPGNLVPIIPVLGELRNEIRVVRNPISQNDLIALADLALDRIKRVTHAMVAGSGVISGLAFNAGWLFLKARIREKLLVYAGRELASHGFVE